MSDLTDVEKQITLDMISHEVETYLKSINLTFVTRDSSRNSGYWNLKKFVHFNTETLNILADYMELGGYNETTQTPPTPKPQGSSPLPSP